MARSRKRHRKTEKRKEHALSQRKKRSFILVTALLPLLFFLTLEAVLRIVGYGGDYPLFIPVPTSEAYLYQNPDVALRYFSRQERVPTGLGDVFRASKDSAEFRIFVQGGSSAAGYPYYYGGSFSRMLEQRLQQTFPDRTIEVVNTGLAAVNSYTLLDFADEIIEQRPDAILIYAGHNEFYGALGVASAESIGRYRPVVNLFLRLRKLRMVQALQSVLASAAAAISDDERVVQSDATLMERMVGEQQVPYRSALYRRGLGQFRGNLRALLNRYQEGGIPVLVGTVASNERAHAPFISGLAAGADEERWKDLYREGGQQIQRGDISEAARTYDDLIAIDSLSAAARFGKAKALDQAGLYQEARTAYLAAKDRDELRFRASEDINRIIRVEAARNGAIVVETQARLAASASDGIIGSDLMLEHLHPNINGYFIIADAFYDALREAGMIGAWDTYVPAPSARRELLVTAVDSLFGVFRLKQLMGRWPFQPPGVVTNSDETIQARDSVEQLALDVHRRKMTWYDATTTLRGYYKATGDYHRALRAGLAVVQQYPFLPRPYAETADILVRQGRLDDALVYFDAANSREETATVYYMMGSIYLLKKQPEPAERVLRRAVDLEPSNVQALAQLTRAYISNGKSDMALESVTDLLKVAPDNRDGQNLLRLLTQSTGPEQDRP